MTGQPPKTNVVSTVVGNTPVSVIDAMLAHLVCHTA